MNESNLVKFYNYINGTYISDTKNLEGTLITVSVVEIPPMLSIIRGENGTVEAIDGYLADLWYILQDQLKFRSIFREPTSGFIGEDFNGTWNGLLGDVQFGRADVGLANLGMTAAREKAVDFSTAIEHGSSKLLAYSNARIESVDWMTFITTFCWEIWLFVGSFWIVASLSLSVISRMNYEGAGFGYIFYLFGALTMQGCEMVPNGCPGRIIFITFWAMCLVTHSYFTAVLTTRLTTAHYKPLTSLRDALDQGFKISVMRSSHQHQGIIEAAAKNSDFAEISQQLEEDSSLIVLTFLEGVETTYDGKTLFLCDTTFLSYDTAENCSFAQQPPEFFTGYLNMPVRKQLPYLALLNHVIVRLHTSGILSRLAAKWLAEDQVCGLVDDGTPSLGLTKTLFPFVVVSSGVIISFLILLSEVAFGSYRRRKMRKEETKRWKHFKGNLSMIEQYYHYFN